MAGSNRRQRQTALVGVVHFKTGDQASEQDFCDGNPAEVVSTRLRIEPEAFDPMGSRGRVAGR